MNSLEAVKGFEGRTGDARRLYRAFSGHLEGREEERHAEGRKVKVEETHRITNILHCFLLCPRDSRQGAVAGRLVL